MNAPSGVGMSRSAFMKDCPAIPRPKDFINVFAENDLSRWPGLWLAPAIPRAVDRRIAQSFLSTSYQLGFASPRTKPTTPEVSMKRCNACDEEFADKTQPEFKVTMIGSVGLGRRLAAEVSFAIEQLQRAWSDFKRDPIGFGRHLFTDMANSAKRFARA